MAQPPAPSPFVRIPLEGEAVSPGTFLLRKFSAKIDPEDEELVRSLGPWFVGGPDWGSYYDWRTRTPYAYSRRPVEGVDPTDFAAGVRGAVTTIYLHDLVMGTGADEDAFPANGDGLDCRKSNLRIRKRRQKKSAS
jgi:hypothetical protein